MNLPEQQRWMTSKTYSSLQVLLQARDRVGVARLDADHVGTQRLGRPCDRRAQVHQADRQLGGQPGDVCVDCLRAHAVEQVQRVAHQQRGQVVVIAEIEALCRRLVLDWRAVSASWLASISTPKRAR